MTAVENITQWLRAGEVLDWQDLPPLPLQLREPLIEMNWQADQQRLGQKLGREPYERDALRYCQWTHKPVAAGELAGFMAAWLETGPGLKFVREAESLPPSLLKAWARLRTQQTHRSLPAEKAWLEGFLEGLS